MGNELETIRNKMQTLSTLIFRRESEIKGLQFGLDLLAEEAARLEATVAAEKGKADAVENRHEGRMAEAEADSGESIRELATRTRRKPNLSVEERERRRDRMRNYWSKKRGETADA